MLDSLPTDFLVIDTEGKDALSEIAIFNAQGQLAYEAFVQGHDSNDVIRLHVKPLADILHDLLPLIAGKTLVFHYAEHDVELLKKSFKQLKLPFPVIQTDCTYLRAKLFFPDLTSYSLDYLSKHLALKVDNHYFNSNAAHTARYDAAFTHQLYRKLMEKPDLNQNIPASNPFCDSRVDTPFQQHVDLKSVYQDEFNLLKSILTAIKADPNHQSKGAIVIGEAGSGKTHLMMRLAQELLKNHRLLFIRQPNNPEAVIYHIYSRILESFVEPVPNSHYSQLEYILAYSFSKIAIDSYRKKPNLTKKEEDMLEMFSGDHLNIYSRLGAEGSDKKRSNWAALEKLTVAWWEKKYSFGGIATEIIRGLIKYCSYSDVHRRDLIRRWLAGNLLADDELTLVNLPNWSEELNVEEFSLQAISVFGRLSIIDEPLIIIFDQLEGLQGNEPLLIQFGNALKEIFTVVPNSLIILNLFPDRWANFQNFFDPSIIDRVSQYRITLNRPSSAELKEILLLKAREQQIDLQKTFTEADYTDILNYHSIRTVLNRAAEYYRYRTQGIVLPSINREKLIFEAQVWQEFDQLREEIARLKAALSGIPNTVSESLSLTPNPETVKVSSTNIFEEQLMAYLTAGRQHLESEYAKKVTLSEYDDQGKLRTIVEAFQRYKSIEVDHLRLGKRKLPEHLVIKTTQNTFVVGFLYATGISFTARLKNFNELVVQHKDYRFRICRDCREPKITGKVALDEIEKLSNAPNGNFYLMEQADRINYELLYKLIIDIQNKDLEIDLVKALQVVESQYLRAFWLIAIFRH